MNAPQSETALLDAAAPTPLAQPPFFEHYLLEEPAAVIILLLGVSLVLFAMFSTRGQPRNARLAAVAGALVGACVLGIAASVDTPREQLAAQATYLVTRAASADAAAVRACLTPNAVLRSPATPDDANLDQIIALVEHDLSSNGQYAVREPRILEVQAALEGPGRGVVQMKIRTIPAAISSPIPSWWRIDFERASESDQWKASRIKLLSIGGGLSVK